MEQNLPVFTVPQEQVQLPAGFGDPQLEQNLPVFTVPQEQVQESPAGAAAGAGAGWAACCCAPIWKSWFAFRPPACCAIFIPAKAIIGPAF